MKRNSIIAGLIILLGTGAAALAAFLLWKSGRASAIPGCGPGSPCDLVLSSRWSRIGPVQVAAFAVPVFLAMACFAYLAASDDSDRRDFAWKFLPTLAFIAAGAAIWFLSLEFFLLHQLCIYCTVTHVLALLASALVFWNWRITAPRPRGYFAPSLVSALILLALLIGAQIRFPPTLYIVSQAPAHASTKPATRPTTVSSTSLSFYNGQAFIESADWPIFGPRQAPHIVALMFDYTCEHCRREYPLILQARDRYGDQLAILAIPLPLEPSCNSAIPKALPEHVNSCTYIRYALAVFKVDPRAFELYHAHLMDGPRPPPLDEARSIANTLVGRARFAAALRDPFIDRRVEDSVQLYRALGTGPIPKLILPEALINGEISPLEHLYDVLESHLEIKPIR